MFSDRKPKFLGGGEQTLNKTGYMVGSLDPYSLEFVDYAGKATGKILDIGACYGIATLAALKAGAHHIIATDKEPRHLEILRSRVPEKDKAKVQCVIGDLPHNLSFKKNSIIGILCSRVLHLLKGEEIETALKHMFNWLKPRGRIHIINDTPYTKYSEKLLKDFLPIHEQRKKAGEKWPGYIENLQYYLQPEFQTMSPKSITLTDVDTLVAACKRCGFEILKAGFIPRRDYPPVLQNDGRENAGVIAVKP